MKGDWGKGYGRKGAALHGLGRFDQAIAAYEKGLDVEPGLAMLTKGLDDAKREAEREKGAGGMAGLGNVFSSPDVISKIVSNPQTAQFMADPTFMMKIQEIQRDPSAISKHMQDPRILQVMGMLMGVNIQTPDSMGADMPSASAPAPPPKKAPEPEPEPEVELTEEEKERKAKKAVADGHKAKGNDAYKAKKFDEAVTHYSAAIEALPDEMTYYNNLAAVFFEQKKFDECIEKCKKAIEIGRSMRADYKVVAKSFARIGNAYKAMDKLDEAKRAYEDSLMEDRVEDVEKRLKTLSKEMAKRATEAYVNPELAEAARQEGNELFKAGKYPAAIEKYSDAMKRNPKSATPYSNRAACYQKLMEWQLALKASRLPAPLCHPPSPTVRHLPPLPPVGPQGRGDVRHDGPDVRQGLVAQGWHPPVPQGVPQVDGLLQQDPRARARQRRRQAEPGAGHCQGQREQPDGRGRPGAAEARDGRPRDPGHPGRPADALHPAGDADGPQEGERGDERPRHRRQAAEAHRRGGAAGAMSGAAETVRSEAVGDDGWSRRYGQTARHWGV